MNLQRSILFLHRCPANAKQTYVCQCNLMPHCYYLKYYKLCGFRVRTGKAMMWCGCYLFFFTCVALSVKVDITLSMNTFFLPWCSVPCLHAEMFLPTQAVWQRRSPGKRTVSGGLWWPRASLRSSRTSPLRLSIGKPLGACYVHRVHHRGKKRCFSADLLCISCEVCA